MNRLASSVAFPLSGFLPFALSLLPTLFAFFPLSLELEAERFFLFSCLPFALLPSALAFVLFSLEASLSFFLSGCLEASLIFAVAAFLSTGALLLCLLSLLACVLLLSFCLPEGERFGRGFEEEEEEDELDAFLRGAGAAAFLRGAGALELLDREELDRARGFGLLRDLEAFFRGSGLLLDLGLADAERDLDGRGRGLDRDLRRGLEELDFRGERLRGRDTDLRHAAPRAGGGPPA